jgi:tripartite-type tricarboxylate transporter receptor subunit TctC
MISKRQRVLVLFIAIAGASWSVFSYAGEAPFYRGKTLTVLINFAAGGPTDIEGRLVGRFLGKHLPGQPAVIVQNMAGAGGVTGANYLGEIAKPDGLTLGYFTGQFFNLLTAIPICGPIWESSPTLRASRESQWRIFARTSHRASMSPRTLSRRKDSRRAA